MFKFAERTIYENIVTVNYSNFIVLAYFKEDLDIIDCSNITKIIIRLNDSAPLDILLGMFNTIDVACLLSGIEKEARFVIKRALCAYKKYYDAL